MRNIIKQFKGEGKINLNQHYVWFKNNYPLNGPLYDDLRIAEIETNNSVFTVQINNFQEEARYTVYGKMNDFKTPLFKTYLVKALASWVNEC